MALSPSLVFDFPTLRRVASYGEIRRVLWCFFDIWAVCQNPGTPGEPQNSWDLWMFIPLKMYL